MASIPSIESSVTFLLGETHYLARPLPRSPKYQPSNLINVVVNQSGAAASSLMTYFKVAKDQVVDGNTLLGWKTAYLDKDDVFHPDFLRDVVFSGVASGDITLTSDARDVLKQWGTLNVGYDVCTDLPNGPYLYYQGVHHSVWRVYEDPQLAFSQSIWPTAQDSRQVDAAGSGYRGHGIAVPSRSYAETFRASTGSGVLGNSSLLGRVRFSVKDNFHVRGIKTTLGNRAFFETYPVQQTSSTVVSRLLGAGAHLVGKTHLSSFAMMEHPMQSIDYQAPFNPRGDGYLIPGGSSSGSAAAAASYDWLDISICTDTTGSSRIPALQTGLFGFRPTTNSISTDGLVHAWADFDTPAWIGRDLGIFPDILRALSDLPEARAPKEARLVPLLLYPTDFIPPESPEQEAAMEDFLDSLNPSTGGMYRKISIQDDWSKTSPVDEKDLHQYLFNLTRNGWYYSAYHTFDSFRKEYKEAHGHDPFVTEIVRWYWQLGREVPESDHNEIMKRLLIFKTWFVNQYMAGGATILALHIGKVQPRYRDQYPGNSNPEVPGLQPPYLSAILNAPELAIPISELAYTSRITNQEENLPVVVSLMSGSGTDLDFIRWTLDALEKSGRPTKVKTGKVMF
ncbi:uncharacterized protein E0L32_005789 [Thyridium curvatum]|uniref:Uncharacterized protein n=1 Tax=Thyridium curvatum TaxID=1093900 RepID=A0A507ASR0_9PEZI|nr:uncharacterized protein E0L32_005789 [Thyridium curvatum]TPX13845.1 hypothetical protein E0L32_005789 [Thyridium curvatum]